MVLSTFQIVVVLVLSVVWAVTGYRLSERDRLRYGRTPWGMPSAVWAFLMFLYLPVGLLLFLIAHSGTVRNARHSMPTGSDGRPGTGPTVLATDASDLFPAYPRPANVPVPDHASPALAPATSPSAAAGPVSPPHWHPDPSTRFQLRWWNGAEWTSYVSTDGHVMVDTNPDQRIGPY